MHVVKGCVSDTRGRRLGPGSVVLMALSKFPDCVDCTQRGQRKSDSWTGRLKFSIGNEGMLRMYEQESIR